MASRLSSTPSSDTNPLRDWEELLRRVATETNRDELKELIKELCVAFDRRDKAAPKIRLFK